MTLKHTLEKKSFDSQPKSNSILNGNLDPN